MLYGLHNAAVRASLLVQYAVKRVEHDSQQYADYPRYSTKSGWTLEP